MTNLRDDKPWRRRALLVAPDPATRKVCFETLSEMNFAVLNATDTGAGAVTLATHEHADVILLSQQLSDVPASEAVKWFRSNKELASTPIIILGARTEDSRNADAWTILLPRPVTTARLSQALSDTGRCLRANGGTMLATGCTRAT